MMVKNNSSLQFRGFDGTRPYANDKEFTQDGFVGRLTTFDCRVRRLRVDFV
jgi:hypothetical protein